MTLLSLPRPSPPSFVVFSWSYSPFDSPKGDSSILAVASEHTKRDMKHVYPHVCCRCQCTIDIQLHCTNFMFHFVTSTVSRHACFPRGRFCSELAPQFGRGLSLVNFWRTRVEPAIVYVRPPIGATIHSRLGYVFSRDVVYVADEGDIPSSGI